MITNYRAGSVFMLDFDKFGAEPPEMVKRRMVVVVSSKALKRDRELVTVVPLSTTQPFNVGAKHNVPLSKEYYWAPGNGATLWAKCDMVMTTSIRRCEHLTAFTRRGQNYVAVPELNRADLKHVRLGVAYAIDLESVINDEAKQELTSYLKRFRATLSKVSKKVRREKAA